MNIGRNEMIKKMVKFWNEQSSNAEDFNSLDIYYENGSYLKFFISVGEYLEMPIAVCSIAYVSEEASFETGKFNPMVAKKSVECFVEEVLDTLYGKHNIKWTVGIERIFENVLVA